MKEYNVILNDILTRLEDYYAEYGNKEMKYTYGYMDAVAVVRNMMTEVPPSDMK